MKNQEFIRGQIAYMMVEEKSNAFHRIKEGMTLENVGEWLLECKVISVGKKFITVEYGTYKNLNMKFVVANDYREHYTVGCSNYKLFSKRQNALDEKESIALYDELRKNYFSDYINKLSLDKLKRIKDILES
ncbi:MAG: hypothetical protein K0R54_1855 [Clostridiaceae bacterium]|jgi:hypothetical protein|nr:hypothetical protein [Clostridiaceae bacterium]